MTPTTIIGIDPGWSGGFAFWHAPTKTLQVAKMPDNEFDIWRTLKPYTGIAVALIEGVHAMSSNGCKGNFMLGQNKGALLCALASLDIPVDKVSPVAWQKRLQPLPVGPGKARTERKRMIRDMMRVRYPNVAKQINLATADAVAIMEYAIA